MKNRKQKRIILLILLMILVILEIIAFRSSSAKKVIPIQVTVKDKENVAKDYTCMMDAREEESGYSVLLPELMEDKFVHSYWITPKEIIQEGNNVIEQKPISKTEQKPGNKFYLTQEETENKKVEIEVTYEKKESKGTVLYHKILEKIIGENSVKVEGYMPEEAILQVKEPDAQQVHKMAENFVSSQAKLKIAYDIKILVGEKEYEPNEFDQQTKVTITGIEKNTKETYKLLHLDENKVEEIVEMEMRENEIYFEAHSFSTYAVFAEEPVVTTPENTVVDPTIPIESNSSEQLTNELASNSYATMNSVLSENANQWDGNIATGIKYGDGTSSKPYIITSGEELAYIATRVNSGDTLEGVYFQLAQDIDLQGREWTPIGNTSYSFGGNFDGAGHIITNAKITISSIPTNIIESYGFFGSLGGGNTTSTIKNLEISDMSIVLTGSGTTSSNSSTAKGYHIGTLVGTVYKNAKITNVIVKNSRIQDTGTITLRNNSFQLAVGGLVGYATNTASSNSDPGQNARYHIENCFVNTEIDLDAVIQTVWWGTSTSDAQYHTGGIIGTIRSQPVWPMNCLYVGTINSNGFIGPIFAGLIGNTSYTSRNNFATLWNGNDSGNLTMNSYYSGFSANGTNFTNTVTSGTSTARRDNSSSNIGYVQGVNKGEYINDISQMLSQFNNNTGTNGMKWKYENGTFSFIPRFVAKVDKTNKPVYLIKVSNAYTTNACHYEWTINGQVDASMQDKTEITIEQTFDKEYDIQVLINDGTYYALVEWKVPKFSLYLEFAIQETTASVTAKLAGDALPYINVNDYTYQWYTEDIAGLETEELVGETGATLTNLEKGKDYRLVATNHAKPILSVEGTFTFGERTVVYVNYQSGSDSNDGFSPEKPVKSMSTAYEKLPSSGEVSSNIIVLMGYYEDTDYLSSETSSTFSKKATVTGIYKKQDYQGKLAFEGESNYRYLNADTEFQHLILDGEDISSWWGGSASSVYFYLQGYSFTMGEGVRMQNYTTANTNQGLIEGNAPAFHIIAGWLQYNYAKLPRNNPEITIKSGTYGRIILGGSPGTNSVSNLQQTTSRNFTGSSLEDTFYIITNIDIQNSTTSSEYTYDINLLVGGSACGNTYANVTENIYAGRIGRVLGASIGDTSNKPRNWDYPINTFLGKVTINMTGGEVAELYGGCLGRNMSALTNSSSLICDSYFYGTITINITGGTITKNIYGAGAGGVTGYSENSSDVYKNYGKTFDTSVNLNISGGTILGDIYGGGYGYTEYLTEEVTAVDGGALYGTSNIIISGSPNIQGNVYAAGRGSDANRSKTKLAQLEGITKIEVRGTPNITGNIYGGGMGISGMEDMAKMTGTTSILLATNTQIEVYGGGNIAKTIGDTKVTIQQGSHTGSIYGGGNISKVEGSTHIYLKEGHAKEIYGGGKSADVTTSNVFLEKGTAEKVYGGGNQAGAINSYVNCQGSKVSYVFGGSNISGTVENSHLTMQAGIVQKAFGGNNQGGNTNITNVITTGGETTEVYGGNNQGGQSNTTHVLIQGGKIGEVYGGGNMASSNTTNVNIENQVEGNVYGGGNQAEVLSNTNVNLINATVKKNVYGGGNEGRVLANTFVKVKNTEILGSLYAGGNGITATVVGNTNLTMEGTTNHVYENVFGGGNQAATGEENKQTSKSAVHIVGGTIDKNVYGGANTSVVYGKTETKIGYEAVANTNLEMGNVNIAGTVFGGGEANASGSEIYDFSFISVTKGIYIQIDGKNHADFEIEGSIFGSGNASSTSGESYIDIYNYGSASSPESNISIQRANRVTLIQSAIALSGAKDRTNEYSDTDFTFSRVDEVKLKNNSIVYLNCGANLLKKLSSVVDENGTEVKGKVTINSQTGDTTKNVDNRVYMAEGKNLNIATNEQVTAYGEIEGMVFFGLFTNTRNPSTSTGMYHSGYQNGDEITNAGTFSSNSYVMAQHMVNHDITQDGFYTNYNEKGKIKTDYIKVTPEEDVYYIWLVGEKMNVTTFEVSLTGSKYATLGTYELSLTGFSKPNIKFALSGFSAGLNSDVSLINPKDILNIAPDDGTANRVYGLTMKSGNNGWQTKNSTTFLTEQGGSYTGNNLYQGDNSTFTPTLNFYFYHSANITEEKKLGAVKIRFQVLIPADDLNYDIAYIDINISLATALYQNDFYESAITPGEEYDLFTTTNTTVSAKSAFSTYYSLYIEDFSNSKYAKDYLNYQRVLVSRDSTNLPYSLPENTRITMLDMVTNQYYYYVVNSNDVASGKYIYPISDFISMGSLDKKYDTIASSEKYYNKEQDLIYEKFIFHIDTAEVQVVENILNKSLLMELRDEEQNTLVGVLGIQRDAMIYSIYKGNDAKIDLSATVDNPTLYLGKSANLTLTTDFIQNIVDSKTIFDTSYFEKKMGIKITFYDENGNQLHNDSLLGIYFVLDNKSYYPRIDGTTRICIADKVSNVLSRIKMETKNNKTLATGNYRIKLESFGSPDGIYYGLNASDSVEVPITIINSEFGLKLVTEDKAKIVEKETGNTLNGNNSLVSQLQYSSGLENPNIRVVLYRRDYSNTYSQVYQLVDLKEYVTNGLTSSGVDKEYVVTRKPVENSTHFLTFKTNLMTGTYRIAYRLYDNENFIGEVYEYFIIQ